VSEYVSTSGNFTAAAQLPGATLVRSGALVSGVEIISSTANRTVVTFGDSITEGFGSTVNAFRGWPDRLAERLAANPTTRAWSVVDAGINDIGYSQTTPSEAVSAEDIIDAYRQLIARAHGHGLRIVGCTIMPFEGSHYYDQHGEQMRQEVNQWIRTAGNFDAVVDFDAALRDPLHPNRVTPRWQRGDQLHPNDDGYAAMAEAIDLKLFPPTPPSAAHPSH
jgi:lysophospholipase L1-like esterase